MSAMSGVDILMSKKEKKQRSERRALEEKFLFSNEERVALNKMREDFLSLQTKSSKILKKIGTNYKSVKKYMSDSRNFNKEEWEFLLEVRKEANQFKKGMLQALGVDIKGKKKKRKKEKSFEEKLKLKKKKARKLQESLKKKNQDKKTSRRRKRTVALRKKWLQM